MDSKNSPPAELAEMIETYNRIDQLEERLKAVGRQIENTYAYLRRDGSNQALGLARYEQLRGEWRDALQGLREARCESLRLLAAS